MDHKALNQLIAKIVIAKNIVPRSLVQACVPEVTTRRDLGQVMVSHGYITPDQCNKIMSYIERKYGALPSTQESNASYDYRPAPAQSPPAPQPREPEPYVEPPSPSYSPPSQSGGSSAHVKNKKVGKGKEASTVLPESFRIEKGTESSGIQPPQSPGPQSSMDEILAYARKVKASDVHFTPAAPITLRRFGVLQQVGQNVLSASDIERIVTEILDAAQLEELKTTGDLELSYTLAGYGRHRMTVAEQRFGWDFSCRLVDKTVRSFSEVGLPESCESLTHWAQGMVLITGPLGCGKSSTMAALVELVNRDRREHIITVENPIELVYQPKLCQITQREVGKHTLSPANALKGALRQDPDILVVSELRDLETIRLAVSAAETGHLVFGTMNTANAMRTIGRLVDSFPPDEQDIMRNMISESLRGIISQQLIPRLDGKGVVPAFEVLMVTKAVSNLIRKNNLHQIESAMVSGRGSGMVLLDHSLKALVDQKIISGEEAFYRSSNPKNFSSYAPAELKGMLDG